MDNNMNTKYLSTPLQIAVLSVAVSCATSLRAATPSTPQPLGGPVAGQYQFQTVAFSDSDEAKMMHRAYIILATGDHDYDGHRVKAMRQVEAAAKLLDLDLSGDLKDHQKQVLSDDKMREAAGLLQNVLGAAEVKGQPKITKHINAAINQINTALSVH
jgi:hypothetical protein